MPTSAAGNESCAARLPRPLSGARGFTLIELLVVIALIAILSAGASLALRDSAASALERDAQRLAAVLESARAQSRASGAPVLWRAQGNGFMLQGLPQPSAPQAWLSEHTRAQSNAAVVLGPEPLIAPQDISLFSAQQPSLRWHVRTDGLRPFAATPDTPVGRP